MLHRAFSSAALAAFALSTALVAQETESEYDFTFGPATAAIGAMAEIELTEGYGHLGSTDTQDLLESWGNITNGEELATVMPYHETWTMFFEFDDVGYVEDDEELDADDLLDSIAEGVKYGNEERRSRGFAEMQLVGWESVPAYNTSTNNLEWGLRLTSAGDPIINHDVRLLGRHGVMTVTLLCDPTDYDASVAEVRTVLEGFRFTEGGRYDQYVSGDKIAEYGLAALVTGGAAAAALKTGFFQKFGKMIGVAALAVAGFFKKIWSKITGKSDDVELAEE